MYALCVKNDGVAVVPQACLPSPCRGLHQPTAERVGLVPSSVVPSMLHML
jgi:hypothetical protein